MVKTKNLFLIYTVENMSNRAENYTINFRNMKKAVLCKYFNAI